MGLDKLTLFELHFDGAQFGPKRLPGPTATADDETDEDATASAATDTADESDGGRRFLPLVAASTAVAVGATLLARRFLGDDEGTTLDEFAEGTDDIEGDEATVEIESDESTA